MADIVKEFKALKLYGMAQCWAERAGAGLGDSSYVKGWPARS